MEANGTPEHARGEASPRNPAETRWILAGIFLTLFLAALDQTIVATALPRITQELHGSNLYAWVATSYLLFATVAGPTFGRLSELIKSKWLIAIATVTFLVGSALCGLAPTMFLLVAARGLQGIGGGAIFAVIFAMLGFMFSPRERGKIQGYFGAVWGLASVVGPYLGGLLTDRLSWRWVFYVNLPVGLVALWIVWRHMPDYAPSHGKRFDTRGAIALATWSIPLTLAISLLEAGLRVRSWPFWTLAAVFAVALVLFVRTERRADSPLVDLTLFEIATVRWANLSMLFYGAAYLGVILFLPLYLILAEHVKASQAGLLLTPLTLGVVTASVVSGRLASRLGRFKRMLVGSLVWFAGAAAVTGWLIRPNSSLWLLGGLLVLTGFGLGPGAPLFALAMQNAVPRERIGTASSTLLFSRQVGGTIGAAVLGVALGMTLATQVVPHLPPTVRLGGQLQSQLENPGALHGKIERHYRQAEQRAGHAPGAAPTGAYRVAARRDEDSLDRLLADGVSRALQRVYWIVACFALIACLAAWRIPDVRLGSPGGPGDRLLPADEPARPRPASSSRRPPSGSPR